MKDWLGNEFVAGDLVLYPNVSGHSPNMVLARVETIKDNGNVVVSAIRGSRWDHWGRTRYTDTRTGKTVDPYRSAGHRYEQSYLNPATGERTDSVSVARTWADYKHAPFKEHIRVEKLHPKITLMVTKNITRWMGPDPAV